MFVSYARPSAAHAMAAAAALRREGHTVWFDEALPGHGMFADVIEAKITGAKAVLVLWSEDAVRSPWVRAEADLALKAGKLVQFSIDAAMPPLPFNQIQCLSANGAADVSLTPAWAKVLESIRTLIAGGGALASQHAAPLSVPTRPQVAPHSIAVLPFSDMSAEHDQGYLGDGVAEEILNALVKVTPLKVSGRTSSFSLKDRGLTVSQIGAALNVAYVLEGSVRKQREQVRITAQLIQTSDGFQVWSESYDGSLADIFDLQDRIARAIVGELEVVLQVDQIRLVARMTKSPQAYDAFLKGRKLAQVQDGEGVLATAIEHLEEAVRLDPDFALAWAWLANANFFLPEHNDAPNWKAYLDAGAKAARAAFKLDPDLSDANLAVGYARLLELDLPGQWEARKRAHELDPESVPAMHEFAMAYALMGLFEKSYPLIEKSIVNDPFSPSFTSALGIYQWVLGDHAAANASFDRSIALGYILVAASKAQMIAASGDRSGAHAYLTAKFKQHAKDVPPQFRPRIAQWFFSLAVTKDTGWARALIWSGVKGDVGNPKRTSDFAFKCTLLLLGEAEAFFSEVRHRPNTYLSGALMNLWIPTPSARRIRTHPGFPQFAEDIGLVRCWQIHGWPPQVQPRPGTDGSNLQFDCR
ncbi:MAG TPA: TIR domain-containing protein [Caulobacteraceae bacterium]|nr:TIR domain-containing protein [Caulobacteraceae bacterium]